MAQQIGVLGQLSSFSRMCFQNRFYSKCFNLESKRTKMWYSRLVFCGNFLRFQTCAFKLDFIQSVSIQSQNVLKRGTVDWCFVATFSVLKRVLSNQISFIQSQKMQKGGTTDWCFGAVFFVFKDVLSNQISFQMFQLRVKTG